MSNGRMVVSFARLEDSIHKRCFQLFHFTNDYLKVSKRVFSLVLIFKAIVTFPTYKSSSIDA